MTKSIKVLMVDDEEKFRSTTKTILDRRGFQTILAGNGEEAISKLGENPDVVILDIKMPGMDGHEALKEIKKRCPDIPVIMLTGHGGLPSASEALAEGAFDYLAKPCDIDILAAKINEAFKSVHEESDEPEEKRVMDAMIPLEEYTQLSADHTVKEAIVALKASFSSKMATSIIMETGHRSIFVMDGKNNVIGIVAITDLIEMIMPGYLSAPKPSTADIIQYSPMFWNGMFTKEIRQKAYVKIREIMSDPPLTIDGTANLMEAAYMMRSTGARRIAVEMSGKIIGIIREQDLFFQMEKILRD